MKPASKYSYWNSKGHYEPTAKKLAALIPREGECSDAKGANKALDRFRRAQNCYYDLFNNGLCNRGTEFRVTFGFSPKKTYKFSPRGNRRSIDFTEELYEQADAVLDKIIIKAAREQNIPLEEYTETAEQVAAEEAKAARYKVYHEAIQRKDKIAAVIKTLTEMNNGPELATNPQVLELLKADLETATQVVAVIKAEL